MKLRKLKILFLVGSIATFFVACQKEVDFQNVDNQSPGGGANNIVLTGNWNFVGLAVKINATVTATQAGQDLKVVVLNDYETIPSTVAGTLTVTDNQFKFIGIGHTATGTASSQSFLNGVLIDDITEPINEVTDPSDQTLDYVRNSNDSITFANPIAFPDPAGAGGGGTPTPVGPMGAKISLSGDTLSLSVKTGLSQTSNQGGVLTQSVFKAESVMKFKRQ